MTDKQIEDILINHLRKCNDLGFLKQSSPDRYQCVLNAMKECCLLTSEKVDNFLRMYPEYRCLDAIGKFKDFLSSHNTIGSDAIDIKLKLQSLISVIELTENKVGLNTLKEIFNYFK